MGVVEPDANGILSRLLNGVADMTGAVLAILEVHFSFARACMIKEALRHCFCIGHYYNYCAQRPQIPK